MRERLKLLDQGRGRFYIIWYCDCRWNTWISLLEKCHFWLILESFGDESTRVSFLAKFRFLHLLIFLLFCFQFTLMNSFEELFSTPLSQCIPLSPKFLSLLLRLKDVNFLIFLIRHVYSKTGSFSHRWWIKCGFCIFFLIPYLWFTIYITHILSCRGDY